MRESVYHRVKEVIQEVSKPVSVDYVRYNAGTSWSHAKAILLEMLVKGEIQGQKTSRSWIFWPKRKSGRGHFTVQNERVEKPLESQRR